MFNLQEAFYGFKQYDGLFATEFLCTVYCCTVYSKYIIYLL